MLFEIPFCLAGFSTVAKVSTIGMQQRDIITRVRVENNLKAKNILIDGWFAEFIAQHITVSLPYGIFIPPTRKSLVRQSSFSCNEVKRELAPNVIGFACTYPGTARNTRPVG